MTDTATLTTRLAEAEAALHKLRTGALEASVDYDGHKVTYSKAELEDLKAYVASLKAELGEVAPRRARRVRFF